ncbi:hypothetical protein FTX61_18000 [Nitriliruptoraceae bacterium ZYF776]|nr:hypothetical protein [Profundirhabdus halotolerans]
MVRSRLLVVVPALLLAACAADGATESATTVALNDVPDDATTVVAGGEQEMRFTPEDLSVPAGEAVFVLDNQGRLVHDLVIDGVQVTEVPGGAQGAGSLELEPGTYEVWCSVPGHRSAGMEGTLEVTD